MGVALLISTIAWFAYNLNKQYTEVVSAVIYAQSDIEGRYNISSNSSQISAKVRTSGFYLLMHNLSKDRQKTVFISSDDLKSIGNDLFEISDASLNKYFEAIFSSEAQLDAYQMNSVQFRFMPEHNKRVPVTAVMDIDYSPQYMNNGGVQLSPDSVTVYGDPARVDEIEQIFTSVISLQDVHSNVNGTVSLKKPGGVRLSVDESKYSIQVMRYFEVSKKVRIRIRNVPAGMKLTIFPNTADVTFRCPFPYRADPAEKVQLYIDYNEYLTSFTGKCVIRADKKTDDMISYSISPEVCDCLAIADE
ncbi:MAG: YbbR-like domain-containing protein [Bacteroidales bacterium]|nr:YbbR-like domain-containing protein [Candidatus Cryptobacteroides fimicaballi]